MSDLIFVIFDWRRVCEEGGVRARKERDDVRAW